MYVYIYKYTYICCCIYVYHINLFNVCIYTLYIWFKYIPLSLPVLSTPLLNKNILKSATNWKQRWPTVRNHSKNPSFHVQRVRSNTGLHWNRSPILGPPKGGRKPRSYKWSFYNPHKWMSRWKLGSMVSKWAITPRNTAFISVVPNFWYVLNIPGKPFPGWSQRYKWHQLGSHLAYGKKKKTFSPLDGLDASGLKILFGMG